MLIKAFIFNGDKGVAQVRGNFRQGNVNTVGLLSGKNENFLSGVIPDGRPVTVRGKIVDGDFRHIGKGPYKNSGGGDQCQQKKPE